MDGKLYWWRHASKELHIVVWLIRFIVGWLGIVAKSLVTILEEFRGLRMGLSVGTKVSCFDGWSHYRQGPQQDD